MRHCLHLPTKGTNIITILLLLTTYININSNKSLASARKITSFVTKATPFTPPTLSSSLKQQQQQQQQQHLIFTSPQYNSKSNRQLSSFTTATTLQMSATTAPTNPFKRLKLTDTNTPPKSSKIIGTHSGSFQADEAMGVWLLRQLPAYYSSKVVRSRDSKILDTCDIVIDVGGTYDHEKLRYDHHQRGYNEKFDTLKEGTRERCSKLSASGLVYRHYGREVISSFYPNLSSEQLELVYQKMYDSFMEPLDAIDTGVESVPELQDGTKVEVLYKERTGLSSRVGRLNPRWNEVDESTGKAPDMDARFEAASQMCGDDFMSVLVSLVESDLPARDFVEKAVNDRLGVDASGQIIVFESGGLPWKQHLYELEKQMSLNTEDAQIKFVLYTDQEGMWRVQAVPVEGQAFVNRLGLPEEWRGVRDEDLSKMSGIEGCRFCHVAGFIGGNETREGALEMARVALTRAK